MFKQELKKCEVGIAHLGLVLAIIVLAAVGGASYLVYQKQTTNGSNETSNGVVDTDEENASSDDGDQDEDSAINQEGEETAAQNQ